MLVTFYQASRQLRVAESVLRMQMVRFPGFPNPVAEHLGKPLYRLSEIQEWWNPPVEETDEVHD